MHDPDLNRLLCALDSAVEWAASNGGVEGDLHHHLDVAALRLKCLSQRLGKSVEESPYLAFVRRMCQESNASASIAASA